MDRRMKRWRTSVVALLAVVAMSCGDDGGAGDTTEPTGDGTSAPAELTAVTVQLKWVTQAQFAGYYAALEEGFYENEGLDVTILPGGPDITPEQVVASGGADFGLNWLPSTLAQRDQDVPLVNIAQVFTRAGITEVAWKDTGIDSIDDLAGKNVGVWCCGNQYPLFAALVKNGIDPNDPSQVTIFDQPFDMNAFLEREIDAAAAMTYNELAQVLEAPGPDGEFPFYTLDQLNVIKLADVGTGMLEDGVFVREDFLESEENQDVAQRFLKATFEGWVFCRDNFDPCLQYVLDAGSQLGEGHQRWQLNEINALIWPNELGIGVMDPELFQTTADISLDFEVIQNEASSDAYRDDLAKAAVAELEADGVDVLGEGYEAQEVEVTEGGA